MPKYWNEKRYYSLDYYLKENEVIISRNFTFDETDKILSGVITDEFSNQVFELFMLSKA